MIWFFINVFHNFVELPIENYVKLEQEYTFDWRTRQTLKGGGEAKGSYGLGCSLWWLESDNRSFDEVIQDPPHCWMSASQVRWFEDRKVVSLTSIASINARKPPIADLSGGNQSELSLRRIRAVFTPSHATLATSLTLLSVEGVNGLNGGILELTWHNWGWALGSRTVEGIWPTFEELACWAVGAGLMFRDRLNQPVIRSRLRDIFKFVSWKEL